MNLKLIELSTKLWLKLKLKFGTWQTNRNEKKKRTEDEIKYMMKKECKNCALGWVECFFREMSKRTLIHLQYIFVMRSSTNMWLFMLCLSVMLCPKCLFIDCAFVCLTKFSLHPHYASLRTLCSKFCTDKNRISHSNMYRINK